MTARRARTSRLWTERAWRAPGARDRGAERWRGRLGARRAGRRRARDRRRRRQPLLGELLHQPFGQLCGARRRRPREHIAKSLLGNIGAGAAGRLFTKKASSSGGARAIAEAIVGAPRRGGLLVSRVLWRQVLVARFWRARPPRGAPVEFVSTAWPSQPPAPKPTRQRRHLCTRSPRGAARGGKLYARGACQLRVRRAARRDAKRTKEGSAGATNK